MFTVDVKQQCKNNNNDIVDLKIFFFFFFFFDVKKILRSTTHGYTENWVLRGFGRHVVRLWTVPNLVMASRTFKLWTGSNMVSSDLEF